MRKAVIIILAVLLVSSLYGCSKKQEQEIDSNIPNPVHDSTAAEILETLGITFHIPDDALEVSYYIIDEGNEKTIAQAKFTRNNIEYTFRIQSKAAFEDISGAYYDWTTVKEIEVSYCSGELRYNDGKEGICLWYDTVPGLMYSVYTGENATEESLMSLANDLFVPVKDAP